MKNNRIVIEHPGYPLNSHGDDFGMTFEGPHNRGFFSSNRGDGRGWDHIYSFEKPEIVQTVKGWVYEMDGYELPAAQVYLVGDDGTNKKLSVKGDGSFTEVIEPGVQYMILATCKGFLNHKEELKVGHVEESEEYTLQFPLASIRVPVLIDNIFYDFDKATLRPESKTALDELVKLLNENRNVTIELSAHCDYRGSAAYNKTLSQRRAEAVVTYLVAHGIPKDRLTPMGYGKEKPKTIRKKLTEKYNWLKEGDVLTEEFIKKRNEKEQEACNQLNRRTEFIVLRTTYGMFDENGKLKNPPQPKKEEGKEKKRGRSHRGDCPPLPPASHIITKRLAFHNKHESKIGEFGQQTRRIWSANSTNLVSKLGDFTLWLSTKRKTTCVWTFYGMWQFERESGGSRS